MRLITGLFLILVLVVGAPGVIAQGRGKGKGSRTPNPGFQLMGEFGLEIRTIQMPCDAGLQPIERRQQAFICFGHLSKPSYQLSAISCQLSAEPLSRAGLS